MNKSLHFICAATICLIAPLTVMAESASFGFRLHDMRWQEKKLYNERVRADGIMFGPEFMYRFGHDQEWAIGAEGLYGSFSGQDHVNLDAHVRYMLTPQVDLLAGVIYKWHDVGASDKTDPNRDLDTSALGGNIGLDMNAPLGHSGFFLFASSRIGPVRMRTDIPDSNTTAWLWRYEGGIAFATHPDAIDANMSLYVAAGYRHEQIKGGDFDQREQAPFISVGVRQSF